MIILKGLKGLKLIIKFLIQETRKRARATKYSEAGRERNNKDKKNTSENQNEKQ